MMLFLLLGTFGGLSCALIAYCYALFHTIYIIPLAVYVTGIHIPSRASQAAQLSIGSLSSERKHLFSIQLMIFIPLALFFHPTHSSINDTEHCLPLFTIYVERFQKMILASWVVSYRLPVWICDIQLCDLWPVRIRGHRVYS